jgi:hypothetical protein
MSTLTAEEKAQKMGAIFDTRTVAAASALLKDCGDSWTQLAGNIDDADGAAAKMAGTMEEGIGGEARKLKSAIEGMGISIGEVVAPTIIRFTEKIGDLIDKFQKLSPAQKKMIVGTLGIVTAAAPALKMGSMASRTIASVASAASGFIGKMNSATSATGAFAKAAGGAASGGAGFLSALGPIAIGAAVAGIAIYALVKAFKEHEHAMYTAEERAAAWDKAVSSAAQNTAKEAYAASEAFKETADSANFELARIGFGDILTEDNSAAFQEAVDKMCDAAVSQFEKRKEDVQAAMSDTFSADGVLSAAENEIIQGVSESYAKDIERVKALNSEITDIRRSAVDEGRAISKEEQEMIDSHLREVAAIQSTLYSEEAVAAGSRIRMKEQELSELKKLSGKYIQETEQAAADNLDKEHKAISEKTAMNKALWDELLKTGRIGEEEHAAMYQAEDSNRKVALARAEADYRAELEVTRKATKDRIAEIEKRMAVLSKSNTVESAIEYQNLSAEINGLSAAYDDLEENIATSNAEMVGSLSDFRDAIKGIAASTDGLDAAWVKKLYDAEEFRNLDSNLRASVKVTIDGMSAAFSDPDGKISGAGADVIAGYLESIESGQSEAEAAANAYKSYMENAVDAMNISMAGKTEESKTLIEEGLTEITNKFTDTNGEISTAGYIGMQTYASMIASGADPAAAAAEATAKAAAAGFGTNTDATGKSAESHINTIRDAMHGVNLAPEAENMMLGFTGSLGSEAARSKVSTAVGTLVAAIPEKIRNALDIHSPSGVVMDLMKYVVDAVPAQFSAMSGVVAQASEKFGSGIVGSLAEGLDPAVVTSGLELMKKQITDGLDGFDPGFSVSPSFSAQAGANGRREVAGYQSRTVEIVQNFNVDPGNYSKQQRLARQNIELVASKL